MKEVLLRLEASGPGREELVPLGYEGSYRRVRAYLHQQALDGVRLPVERGLSGGGPC
ncbi:hypothetical protein ACWFQ8_20470 [Streptomyces sp. NPDC055254]